jgi:hypothetical protein
MPRVEALTEPSLLVWARTSVTALLAAFLLSCLIAYGLARWSTRKVKPTLRPGRSVWYEVFSRRGENMVRVTVELRDGRRDGFSEGLHGGRCLR